MPTYEKRMTSHIIDYDMGILSLAYATREIYWWRSGPAPCMYHTAPISKAAATWLHHQTVTVLYWYSWSHTHDASDTAAYDDIFYHGGAGFYYLHWAYKNYALKWRYLLEADVGLDIALNIISNCLKTAPVVRLRCRAATPRLLTPRPFTYGTRAAQLPALRMLLRVIFDAEGCRMGFTPETQRHCTATSFACDFAKFQSTPTGGHASLAQAGHIFDERYWAQPLMIYHIAIKYFAA